MDNLETRANFLKEFLNNRELDFKYFLLLGIILSFNLNILSILYLKINFTGKINTDLYSTLGPFFAITLLFYSIFVLLGIYFEDQTTTYLKHLSIIGLIIIIFATPAIFEGTARFGYAYRIGGLVNRFVNENLPIFSPLHGEYNWPIVFLFSKFLILLLGLNLQTIMLWTPIITHLIEYPIINAIANEMEIKSKSKYFMIIIFYLLDWVNQDFFSPQQLGFLILLFGFYLLLKVNRLKFSNFTNKWFLLFLFTFITLIFTHGLSSVALLFWFCVMIIIKPNEDSININLKGVYLLLSIFIVFLIYIIFLSSSRITKIFFNTVFKTSIFDLISSSISLGINTSGNFAGTFFKILFTLAFSILALIAIFLELYKKYKLKKKSNYMFIYFSIIVLFCDFVIFSSGLYYNESIIRAYLYSLAAIAYLVSFLYNKLSLNQKYAFLIFLVLAIQIHFYIHYANESFDYIPQSELNGTQTAINLIPINSTIFSLFQVDYYFSYKSGLTLNSISNYNLINSSNYVILPTREINLINQQPSFLEVSSKGNLVFSNSGLQVYQYPGHSY